MRWNTLRHICSHLQRVAQARSSTKMSRDALAIVFAPMLFRVSAATTTTTTTTNTATDTTSAVNEGRGSSDSEDQRRAAVVDALITLGPEAWADAEETISANTAAEADPGTP